MAPDRRTVRVATLSVGTLLLLSCQTGPVSVEEARRITEQVDDAPAAAPPPSIDDILALLEGGPAAEWAARMASDRSLADQAPPPGPASRADLARFYHRRGVAAQDAGRAQQQLADLRRAVDLGQGTFGVGIDPMLSALGYAEQFVGRYSRHAVIRQQALDATVSPGARLVWHMVLARHYADLNDTAAADSALAHASSYRTQQDGGERVWARFNTAYYLYGRAAVARAQGDAREAEGYARQAIVELDAMGSGGERRTTIHDLEDGKRFRLREAYQELAAALSDQNRLLEAEVEARKAVAIAASRYGRDGYETALALLELAEVIIRQGRAEDGGRLGREALVILDRIGAAREALGRARARRLIALSFALRDEWAAAVAELETISREMAEDPDTLTQFFQGDVDWAVALIQSGKAAEAAARLGPVVEAIAKRLPSTHYPLAETRGVLAAALAASGEAERASGLFRAAVPLLLASAPRSDQWGLVSLQERRRQWILEGYVGFMAQIKDGALERSAGLDAVAEAFRAADAARGRSVQQALSAGAARTAAARDPALLDLVQREQNIDKQVAGLYRQMAALAARPKQRRTDKDRHFRPEALTEQVVQLTRAHEALRGEIRQRFPGYAELMDPQPATLEEARTALRDGEALLAVLVARQRTYVWAVPRSGAVAFAVAEVSGAEMANLVGRVRRSVTPVAGTLAEQPVFDAQAAHRIYEAVLGIVEPGWRGAKTLVVVPHGPLGQLPFALLLSAETTPAAPSAVPFSEYAGLPWLARQVAITHLPSVASLRALRAAPSSSGAGLSFVGFGDPWFSLKQARRAEAERQSAADRGAVSVRAAPDTARTNQSQLADLPRLPDTAEEVMALAQALGADPARDVFLGRRANEQMIKSADLSRYRVLAFATHGLTPGAIPGLTQPALALTAPEVAEVEGDGLLTMEEILELRLNAEWVVLSACDTAASAGVGAEAVSGLGRAFFYAGTRAVLVTHWPVETTSARALTTELFRRQGAHAGLTRAEALREAQLALIDRRARMDSASAPGEYSYAHPMFWAPFALVGDGGR